MRWMQVQWLDHINDLFIPMLDLRNRTDDLSTNFFFFNLIYPLTVMNFNLKELSGY